MQTQCQQKKRSQKLRIFQVYTKILWPVLKRCSMKYTDFNRTCESPTVVTLWAGALCARRKLSFMPHYWLTSGGGAFCFFSFFNFRFSFRLSWAFFCFSLLPLSFFPLSAIFVSPCVKMTCAGLWRRNPFFGR